MKEPRETIASLKYLLETERKLHARETAEMRGVIDESAKVALDSSQSLAKARSEFKDMRDAKHALKSLLAGAYEHIAKLEGYIARTNEDDRVREIGSTVPAGQYEAPRSQREGIASYPSMTAVRVATAERDAGRISAAADWRAPQMVQKHWLDL